MSSCMLTAETKVWRAEICQQHYKNEDDKFLHNIVTSNEMWVPHCEPETKHQHMDYHHRYSHVKKKSKHRLWQEKSWLHFLVLKWCYSRGLPWNWDHHQLTVLHCNTLNFETLIKKSSEAQEEHFAAMWQTTLGLTPPCRQLSSWTSPSHHTCYKVQIWCHASSSFSSRNEGWSVRTWIKKQNVEFCYDSFEKLVYRWWKCVENGGNVVEKWIQVITGLNLFVCFIY